MLFAPRSAAVSRRRPNMNKKPGYNIETIYEEDIDCGGLGFGALFGFCG